MYLLVVMCPWVINNSLFRAQNVLSGVGSPPFLFSRIFTPHPQGKFYKITVQKKIEIFKQVSVPMRSDGSDALSTEYLCWQVLRGEKTRINSLSIF